MSRRRVSDERAEEILREASKALPPKNWRRQAVDLIKDRKDDRERITALEAERDRYREALRRIATTQPEVSVRGVCSYCNSIEVANEALSQESKT